MSNPAVRMEQEGSGVVEQFEQRGFRQQSQLGETDHRLDGLNRHRFLGVAETLLQQRFADGRTAPADVRRHSRQAVEEGAAQVSVVLVVQVRYDVTEYDVTGCQGKSIISDQFQSSFRAVSEQFQSSFRI